MEGVMEELKRQQRRSTLPFTHIFGLGGMSLVLVGMLMATGILLMLAYQPTPAAAYDSIQGLEQNYLFGGLVRNIHHWSAGLERVKSCFYRTLTRMCTLHNFQIVLCSF